MKGVNEKIGKKGGGRIVVRVEIDKYQHGKNKLAYNTYILGTFVGNAAKPTKAKHVVSLRSLI